LSGENEQNVAAEEVIKMLQLQLAALQMKADEQSRLLNAMTSPGGGKYVR
jgi:hypothetical protein